MMNYYILNPNKFKTDIINFNGILYLDTICNNITI
jgi:hypothetical protein